jgi:NFU1 iron-sulfur cluster scaffold homolog, mitochondrial
VLIVTKDVDENWSYLKNMVFSELFDFFASGVEVVHPSTSSGSTHVSDTTILDDDDEIVATIKELFETRLTCKFHPWKRC